MQNGKELKAWACGTDYSLVRVKALRDAFMAVAKDPAFVAASKAQQLEVEPVSGERIQAIVRLFFFALGVMCFGKGHERLLRNLEASLADQLDPPPSQRH